MSPVAVGSAAMHPLFMFGFERSGTTLLSMMAGAHPKVAVPLTVTGLWYRYHQRLGRYNGLASREDAARLVDELLEEERIRLWDVDLDRNEVLDELPLQSYPAVIRRFHELYADKKGKPHWGNLDIATLDAMDIANAWFPDARFLHIVRDGRDVALSHETMPYRAGNLIDTVFNWNRRIRTNLKMGAMLGAERYRTIRYEDLILKPESTLREICEFAGIDYAPEMMDYPSMVDEKVPDDRRWLWPALDKPPDPSKVYGWKRKMGASKRIVFESEAKALLDELGYETYDRVPKRASAYAYELLCLVGRGGRFGRLTSKLGVRRKSRLQRNWGARHDYESVQKSAFKNLTQTGGYDASFDHAEPLKKFFHDCLERALGLVDADAIDVLECGCGTGVWIDTTSRLTRRGKRVEFFGFDLTPEMVDVARERLRDRIPFRNIRVGDILDDDAYTFERQEALFQVIYAFDVVQQLPRARQLDACLVLARHLAPGGCALVFDHERWSRHGIRMGVKKLATEYLRLRLVPEYYCNARYPALAKLAEELAASPDLETAVWTSPSSNKRALVIRKVLGRPTPRDRSESPTIEAIEHGIG